MNEEQERTHAAMQDAIEAHARAMEPDAPLMSLDGFLMVASFSGMAEDGSRRAPVVWARTEKQDKIVSLGLISWLDAQVQSDVWEDEDDE